MARVLSKIRTMRTIFRGLLSVVLFVACSNDSSPTPPDAQNDAMPGNTVCGGFSPMPCAATEYCDYSSNSCGVSDDTGICKPRPQFCPAVADPPVCGCNGMVYSSDCAAYLDGTDINTRSSCSVVTAPSARHEHGRRDDTHDLEQYLRQ